MSYRRRWASGLVCILMVAGAWRASAGSISIVGDAQPLDGDPLSEGICKNAAGRLFFHSQGRLLWGTRPSWDDSVPVDFPTNVLRSIVVSEGTSALRQNDGQLSGTSLLGSLLMGEDSDGLPVKVVLCGSDSEADPGTNWTLIEAWNPLSNAWENPCVATPEVPNPRALLLSGTWDSKGAHHDDDRRITVACQTGALAKCVAWGYRPWGVDYRGRSLAMVHQTCTRMARADYCGDGVSHTREGNVIDYYDTFGIAELDPSRSEAAGETFEAAWGPDGAGCFTRLRDGQPAAALDQECPGRFQKRIVELQEGDECLYSSKSIYSILRTRTVMPTP